MKTNKAPATKKRQPIFQASTRKRRKPAIRHSGKSPAAWR